MVGLALTSQSEATQSPTAVLGYKRAELAYVPTNRATATKTTQKKDSSGVPVTTEENGIPNTGSGAKDSANVLMELRYRGIFSWGENSGIYQRLAVGDIAVTQPGAAFMFSKDDSGKINDNVAKYVADAQLEISTETKQAEKIIAYVTDGSDTVNSSTLDNLVKTAATANPSIVTSTVSTQLNKSDKGSELKALLLDSLDTAISPLYKALPTDKQ